MKSKTKQCIIRNGVLLGVLALFLAAHFIWGITCPLYAIFGTPCPTCGVTRAMICLVQLDFQGYWAYHPLALPLCVAVVLAVNGGKNKWIAAYAILVALATFLLWIFRVLV